MILLLSIFSRPDNEVEDLLSCDEEVLTDVFQWWVPPLRRIPPLLWVRIRSELAPYLVERGLEGGAPVLTWYHRQFSETAAEVGCIFQMNGDFLEALLAAHQGNALFCIFRG